MLRILALAPVLLPVLLVAGCGAAQKPAVDGAWVRLPAVAGRPGAAYFTLSGGASGATLLKVSTPAAIRTELHESMAGHSGMMSMKPIAQVAVAGGEQLAFAPGGKHVMLYDVSPSVKPGQSVPLSLALADGSTLTAEAKVVAAGDAAPTK